MTLEQQFTKKQAAARVGLSIDVIKRAMAKREFAFRKFGDGKRAPVLIAESELLAWFERRTRFFPSAEAS